MLRSASIVVLLAPLLAGPVFAQADTGPLSPEKRIPANIIKGAEADSIVKAVQGRLEIVDFSPARVLSSQRVKLKDVGNAVRYNIRYEIVVHNPGNDTRQFRIITEVAEVPRSRSALFDALSGQRLRKTQNATFVLPSHEVATTLGLLNPNSRPVRVRVVDTTGRELDSVNLELEGT